MAFARIFLLERHVLRRVSPCAGERKRIMTKTTLEHLRSLIHKQTGLRDRNCDSQRLRKLVDTRVRALNLTSIDEYATLLESGERESRAELRELTVGLTTGETHFFSDRGQFDLLEKTILPRLIEERSSKRTLRIWSEGCSTGDEAYSMAIALDSLLSNRPGWTVDIRGTDINPASIDKARAGTYTNWSFRVIRENLKSTYFDYSPDQWTLKSRIRQAVRFSILDLIRDSFPSIGSGIHDMDLILCRNVFIYFEPDSVRRVLQKMSNALRPGGYLLTAHGEVHGHELDQLEALSFPESSVYRRRPLESQQSRLQTQSRAEAQNAAANRSPAPSVAHCEQLARECANKADYQAAEEWCHRALTEDPFSVSGYYLLGKIAEERKQMDRAKELLKKVLYLDPSYIPAYLDLAEAYDREKDWKRARRL